MMNESWKKVRISEIAPYWNGKIDAKDLNKDNYISTENMLPEKGGIVQATNYPINRVTDFKQNDILVSNIRPYFKKIWLADMNGGCSNDIIVFRTDAEIADAKFIYYSLSKDDFFNFMMAGSNGTKMPRGNKKSIINYRINLPPLPTQQKIASILSAYDDLIENNNKRIQLLEQMASEIYKEWFVRLRFPKYKNTTVLDGIPEGWEKKRLKDLISFYIGGGWGKDEVEGKYTEEAYVIRGTDIPKFNDGNLNKEVLRYHTESNLSSRAMQDGDIVFEVSGGTESQWLGRSCILTQKALDRYGKPVMPASFCKLIRAEKTIIEPVLLYQFFNRIYYTGEVSIFQVQSTGISNYQFEDFIHSQKILVPTEDIQLKFKEIILPMLDEVQVLGEKNKLLQQTRDLLLPRLISGKLEV